MSFSSKITSSDLTNKGVIGLPDTPGLSTSAMQNKLEETVRTVAIPKHNDLIDELENSSAADSIGATAPTGLSGTSVQALINDLNAKKENNSSALPSAYGADPTDTFNIRKLTDTYKIAFSDLVASIKTAIGNATTSVSGLFSDTDKTKLDGIESGAQVNTVASVNSMTGAVVLAASDVGALPDTTPIPSKTSDLTNDSNFATASDVASAVATKSTVAWNQLITTGQKIATLSIDGTPTDVFAPTGGGGGGGAVDSVNGMTGIVILGVNDIDDVTITSAANNDALVYDNGDWQNKPLKNVAFSGAYSDLSGTPGAASTTTNGLMSSTDKSKLDGIASGAEANVQSDWNQANSSADDFIKNKPTIPTVDQTYSSSSPNAQSGTAVASAISGKANSSDLDGWSSIEYTNSSGVVAFSLNDSNDYDYDPYADITPPLDFTIKLTQVTGKGTSSCTLTYQTTGLPTNTACKLRILK